MKTAIKKIEIILEKTDTGYSAFCVNYPIYTTGRTFYELMDYGREAANLCFEDESVGITQKNLKFDVDFSLFFQYYRVINTKVLADKIGMNHTLLSQYVQGRRRASEKQTEKILFAIHQIEHELSKLNRFS